jgi:(p)ppGpp synthase/HD superfamily hydrolase
VIIEAAQFAARYHAGQVRKYNGKPYITHPIRVAGRMATHPSAMEWHVAAAFLHDVVALDTIDELFGTYVAECVAHLTNAPKIEGMARAERKRLDRERIAKIPKACKVIKLIDRIDNLSELDRKDRFAPLYARESFLLADVLEDADRELANELRCIATEIALEGLAHNET